MIEPSVIKWQNDYKLSPNVFGDQIPWQIIIELLPNFDDNNGKLPKLMTYFSG